MNSTLQEKSVMKLCQLCVLFFALMLLPSCVFTNTVIPLDTDVQETDLGDKVGEASNQSVMWLAAWGDGGMQAAAENGGIKTLKHADRRVLSVLFGLYTRTTTIVYGN
ncbi:MAG: TRL domain-containing protein [Planctomycetota bacterium]|jgi:hypothetical protein